MVVFDFGNWRIDLFISSSQEFHSAGGCHDSFPSAGVQIRVGLGLTNAQAIKELGTVCMVPMSLRTGDWTSGRQTIGAVRLGASFGGTRVAAIGGATSWSGIS